MDQSALKRDLTRRDVLRLLPAAAALSAINAAWGLPSGRRSPQGKEGYWLGCSYYPEQWGEAQWVDDFAGMQRLGLTVVRMAEFAWARLEPAPGKFDFGWLDRAVELAREHGIAVVLGTPTASLPPWLHAAHPEVLGVDERGRFTYGGRKGGSLCNAELRLAARRILTAMGEHYGANSAVTGWQIDNEPGFPFENYDECSQQGFRQWLQQRYGTVSALNAAWGGDFWSNRFDDWGEIEFPFHSAEGGWRAESKLDYRRFFSIQYIDWLRFQCELLRPLVRSQFLYTNWPNTTWSVNVFEAAQLFDYTAWDNYVAMPGDAAAAAQLASGFNHDLARCSQASGRFFVSEQAVDPPLDAAPGSVRLQTWIDIAHGSRGTLYFEWRPPLAGNEQAYPSLLDVSGSPGPSFGEVQKTAAEIFRLWPMLRETHVVADVALLFSYDNEWDRGFWQSNGGLDRSAHLFYCGLKAMHRNVDVVPPTVPLQRYRLIVAPGLQIVSQETASSVLDYVRQGGVLVLDGLAGTREETGALRPLQAPGPFAEAAGIRIPNQLAPDPPFERFHVRMGVHGQAFACSEAPLPLELAGATVLAMLEKSSVPQVPAITHHRYGSGAVVFVGCASADVRLYQSLFMRLAALHGIAPLLGAPAEVEVCRLTGAGSELLFALNLSGRGQTVVLDRAREDLITQRRLDGNTVLPPCGVLILK